MIQFLKDSFGIKGSSFILEFPDCNKPMNGFVSVRGSSIKTTIQRPGAMEVSVFLISKIQSVTLSKSKEYGACTLRFEGDKKTELHFRNPLDAESFFEILVKKLKGANQ